MRRPSEERQWEQEMNLVLMPGEIEEESDKVIVIYGDCQHSSDVTRWHCSECNSIQHIGEYNCTAQKLSLVSAWSMESCPPETNLAWDNSYRSGSPASK